MSAKMDHIQSLCSAAKYNAGNMIGSENRLGRVIGMQNLQKAQQHVQSVIRKLEAIEENTGTRCNSPESILEALMEMFRYKDIPKMVDELKEVSLFLESKTTLAATGVENKTAY